MTLILVTIFMVIGTVSAADVNDTGYVKYDSHSPASYDNSSSTYNSSSDILDESGCCSILVHVNSTYDVFAYRRDSTYTANLYIQKLKWYGKETIKEYKTTNGYFFHTIIASGGWIISTGGPDVVYLNKQLEALGGKTMQSGKITTSTLNSAYYILRKLRMGHFLIKAPNGNVGVVVYNGGRLKKYLFTMKPGQYVSVPNSPSYYRSGYTAISQPVTSAIKLAISDRWGVNRRNIIVYEVNNTQNTTNIKVWATTCRGTPDNIIFLGKTIGKYTIPRIPTKKYIGAVSLKR